MTRATPATPAASGGMSAAQFICPDCGKCYKWRDELAGKKIRCKGCGVVFTPSLGANPVSPQAEALAAAAARSGFVIPTRTTREMAAEEDEMRTLHNWVLPAIVLALGLLWRTFQAFDHAARFESVALWQSLLLVLAEWLVASLAVAGAIAVAVTLVGMELGRTGPALFKAAAAALLMAALANFCSSFDRTGGDLNGMALGVPGVLLIGFVMFAATFKADLLEALLSSVAIVLLVTAVLMAMAGIFTGDAGVVLGFGRPTGG